MDQDLSSVQRLRTDLTTLQSEVRERQEKIDKIRRALSILVGEGDEPARRASEEDEGLARGLLAQGRTRPVDRSQTPYPLQERTPHSIDISLRPSCVIKHPQSNKWVEISCHICHTNVTQAGSFLDGLPGLRLHYRRHGAELNKSIDWSPTDENILRFCITRELDEEYVLQITKNTELLEKKYPRHSTSDIKYYPGCPILIHVNGEWWEIACNQCGRNFSQATNDYWKDINHLFMHIFRHPGMGKAPRDKLRYIWENCRVWESPHTDQDIEDMRKNVADGDDPIAKRIIKWMAEGNRPNNDAAKRRLPVTEADQSPSKRNRPTTPQDHDGDARPRGEVGDDRFAENGVSMHQRSLGARIGGSIAGTIAATRAFATNAAHRQSSSSTDIDPALRAARIANTRTPEAYRPVLPGYGRNTLSSSQFGRQTQTTGVGPLSSMSPDRSGSAPRTIAAIQIAHLKGLCPCTLSGHECMSSCEKPKICLAEEHDDLEVCGANDHIDIATCSVVARGQECLEDCEMGHDYMAVRKQIWYNHMCRGH